MPHPLLPELENLASNTAAENGFDICSVQVLTHLIPMTMQVQIRHLGGGDVSLDDCARFSSPMGDAIEASQLLNEAYVLEISSPGISTQLNNDRDFQTFRGFPVEVIFRSDNDSELCKNGLLLQRSNEHVEINIKGRIKRICRAAVISVQLTNPTD